MTKRKRIVDKTKFHFKEAISKEIHCTICCKDSSRFFQSEILEKVQEYNQSITLREFVVNVNGTICKDKFK